MYYRNLKKQATSPIYVYSPDNVCYAKLWTRIRNATLVYFTLNNTLRWSHADTELELFVSHVPCDLLQ